MSTTDIQVPEDIFLNVLRRRLKNCRRWVVFVDDGSILYHGPDVNSLSDVNDVIASSLANQGLD